MCDFTVGKMRILLRTERCPGISHYEQLAKKLNLEKSTVSKWVNNKLNDNEKLWKKPPEKTFSALLKVFHIEDPKVLELNDEDFTKWCKESQINLNRFDVFLSYSTTIDAIAKAINDSRYTVMRYRAHPYGEPTEKSVLTPLLLRRMDSDNRIQVVQQIVTSFSMEDDSEIKNISEKFIKHFNNENSVDLSIIDRGYLAISLLVVDEKKAVVCLPSDDGKRIHASFMVDNPTIAIALAHFFRRIFKRAKCVFQGQLKNRESLDVLIKLNALLRASKNKLATLNPTTHPCGPEQPHLAESNEKKMIRDDFEYLESNSQVMKNLEQHVDDAEKAIWIFRSHTGDGRNESNFINKLHKKCTSPEWNHIEIKRFCHIFQCSTLISQLQNYVATMMERKGFTLGVIEWQIDTLNIAIFDYNSVVLGFLSECEREILCGLKISNRALVRGFINAFLLLERKLDKILVSDYLNEAEKEASAEYLNKYS